jgi:hypothetical protein
MSFFGKKADPISDRAKQLNKEIADLEATIRRLSAQPAEPQPPQRPKMRSTVTPAGPVPHSAGTSSHEPIFEAVPPRPAATTPGPASDPGIFNDMGVRKYDLVGFFRRLGNLFQGRTPTNPKLVSLIAAGNIHGLRSLRYEKRVARNRFIVVAIIFVLVVWGILALLARR